MAQFRTDVEGFVTREVAEACVPVGVFERAPLPAVRYLGFVDPSGGSQDAFTLGIAHRQEDNMFLDCVREVRPPFSPESVIGEFAATLRSYRISRAIGDRYAGEFPREIFRKCGIAYEPSQKSKSDLYVSLLPLLNSRRVELLDHPRLVTQLINLERRVARSGKDSVDHPPGSHDDLINAAAGAVLAAQNSHKKRLRMGVYGYGGGPVTEIDPVTLRPIHAPEHTRVRCVKVRESEVPAVKGYG